MTPELDLAWEERFAAAKPVDVVRGCVINSIFAVARRHMGEPAVRALDPERTGGRQAFTDYPVSTALVVLRAAVPLLAPLEGGAASLMRRIGSDTIDAVKDSPIGKAGNQLRGNPKGLLQSFANSATPLLVGYGSRSLEWRGEREARITYRRGLLPAGVHAGMYGRMLEAVGAQGVKVDYREFDGLTQEFDISWDSVQ